VRIALKRALRRRNGGGRDGPGGAPRGGGPRERRWRSLRARRRVRPGNVGAVDGPPAERLEPLEGGVSTSASSMADPRSQEYTPRRTGDSRSARGLGEDAGASRFSSQRRRGNEASCATAISGAGGERRTMARVGIQRKGAKTQRRKKAGRGFGRSHRSNPLTTRWMPCRT
jgi:hypothetical protein